ncbi:hypothetical protein CBM2623_B10068 [Cupriavidus taiwanensis]|nr:hypothetical protein CBM2608_B10065 [Cupriavidus taiwanensis]SPA31877.1 hypothetical protein CBM2623_B10068 [Cupriavidus taiwanensis]
MSSPTCLMAMFRRCVPDSANARAVNHPKAVPDSAHVRHEQAEEEGSRVATWCVPVSALAVAGQGCG